jgi:ABC-type antimicrobial peptide transport system permease subunit
MSGSLSGELRLALRRLRRSPCFTAAAVLTGIVVGFAGAVLLGRTLAPELYEVSPSDPPTYALVALILFGAAAVACAIPARRASGSIRPSP